MQLFYSGKGGFSCYYLLSKVSSIDDLILPAIIVISSFVPAIHFRLSPLFPLIAVPIGDAANVVEGKKVMRVGLLTISDRVRYTVLSFSMMFSFHMKHSSF